MLNKIKRFFFSRKYVMSIFTLYAVWKCYIMITYHVLLTYFFKNMIFEYLHAFSGTGVAFVCALYELFLNEKFRGVGTGWVEWAFLHLGCPPNVWQTQGIENHIICSQRFIFTIWPPISRLHPKHLTGV